MLRLHQILAILLTIVLFMDVFAKGNRKEKARKKDKLKSEPSLCAIEDNSFPLQCSCFTIDSVSNRSKLECWVFTGVTKDHGIWSLFATQKHVTELKFVKRPTEQFTFVPTKAIKYLTDLRTLQIIYANIYKIHSYAFANLTRLSVLKLTRNQIITLEHHAFAHLTNLTELYLDENKIAEFKRDVFVDLPNLQKLYAAKNNLSVIDEGCFKYLTHLTELQLDSNYISVLTTDTFSGLGVLKKLDLSNNMISMLGDLTFSELWELEELNLESNVIEFVSDRAFAGLTHLKELDLAHNKLRRLGVGVLRGMSTIYYLDLRFNQLETLTLDNIKPILPNLVNSSSYFYMTDNKFVCDCRLVWMHSLRNETKNERIKTTLDETTCYMELPVDDISPVTASSLATDPKINSRPASHESGSKDHSNNKLRYNYEQEYDDDDAAAAATDDEQDDDSENYISESSVPDKRMKRFFEIPPKELPCPQKERPTESPSTYLYTPGFAEINANFCFRLQPSFSLILMVLILYLT